MDLFQSSPGRRGVMNDRGLLSFPDILSRPLCETIKSESMRRLCEPHTAPLPALLILSADSRISRWANAATSAGYDWLLRGGYWRYLNRALERNSLPITPYRDEAYGDFFKKQMIFDVYRMFIVLQTDSMKTSYMCCLWIYVIAEVSITFSIHNTEFNNVGYNDYAHIISQDVSAMKHTMNFIY